MERIQLNKQVTDVKWGISNCCNSDDKQKEEQKDKHKDVLKGHQNHKCGEGK